MTSQTVNPDDPEVISSGESSEKTKDAPMPAAGSSDWSAGYYSSKATIDSPKEKAASPEDETMHEEEVSSPTKVPSDSVPAETMVVDQPLEEATETLATPAAKGPPTPILLLKEAEEVVVPTPTTAVVPSAPISSSKSSSVGAALERILKKKTSTSSEQTRIICN